MLSNGPTHAAEAGAMLTRSLAPRSDVPVILYDLGRWRLVYFREIGEAWWCVPGSRALGSAVVVGVV